MRHVILTIALICAAFLGTSVAQRFLQLEKVNSPKVRKYYPGNEITFQLSGDQWYTRIIEEVSYEEKTLLFANGHVHVDSILAFRTFEPRKWSRPVGNQLYNFAVAWTGFSLISAAVDDSDTYTRGDVAVAAASAATGFLLKQAFKKRTFRLKKHKDGSPKRWKLRAMDTTVK